MQIFSGKLMCLAPRIEKIGEIIYVCMIMLPISINCIEQEVYSFYKYRNIILELFWNITAQFTVPFFPNIFRIFYLDAEEVVPVVTQVALDPINFLKYETNAYPNSYHSVLFSAFADFAALTRRSGGGSDCWEDGIILLFR